MKKFLSILVVTLVCAALLIPVSATEWYKKDLTNSLDSYPDWVDDATTEYFVDSWEDGKSNAMSGSNSGFDYVYLKDLGLGDYTVEFNVKEDGYYDIGFMLMAWSKSVLRSTNVTIDDAEPVYVGYDYKDEDQFSEHYWTGLQAYLTKGAHKFTLSLASDFDNTNVKSLYFVDFFYNFIGKDAPAAETPAEETKTEEPSAAASAIAMVDYIDYTPTDVAVSTGAFDTIEEAAASVELTPITGYEFVIGTASVSDTEDAGALWDDDVTTKFCVADSNQFPTISVAKLSAPATVSGIAFATANDNSKYVGRNPFEWAVFVSADGANWTQLAYGDDTFLEDVDFTYYATKTQTVENIQYVKFQSEGGLAGVFQMSEVVLLAGEGTAAPAPAEEPKAEEPAETPAETVETPAEAPAETVETPVETAPQTFDAAVIAAVAAAVSLAGYAVLKKR